MDTGLVETLPTPDSRPIRKFADSGVQAAIDAAIATLPPGAHVAAVAHAYGDGAAVSIVARVGAHWSVAAAAYKPWHGPLEAEAAVRWSA